MSWNRSNLASVVSLLESGSRPKGGASSESGEIPSLGGENILRNGGVILDGVKRVPEKFFERMNKGHLLDADVLINKDGAQTGKVGLFRRLHRKPCCINEHLFLIRGNAKKITQEYLYYTLLSQSSQNQIEAQISGSAQPGLKSDFLHGVFAEIPESLSEQTKIAEILSTVDQAIEQTKALIAKQQRIKAGLMQDLLTRGIDDDGSLRSEQTHEFKDSPLGRIPVEWEVRKIQELLADVNPPMRSGPFGSTLLKEELLESGIPFLGIDNVLPEEFVPIFKRFVEPKKAKQLKQFRVRPRDVLITIMGTVGQCCMVPDDIGEALSSKHVWTISFDEKIYSPYIACIQINYSPWVLNHFAKDMQGGIMASIRSETLRSTRLPVPPRDEMQEIEVRLRAISTVIGATLTVQRKLISLKSALLQDLLTGKVSVRPILPEAEIR